MARSEQEVREILAERFGDELTVCLELLEHVDDQMANWTGRAADWPADFIVLAELARTVKTARAALMLCRQGFGEQAATLSRSLFEGMAVAHWVHAHPDEAASRFEKHSRHTAVVFTDALERQNWLQDDEERLAPADQDERDELVKMFGLYGERLWTGHRNLPDLVDAIDSQWTDETSRAELHAYLDVANRFHNKLLHATSTALHAAARESSSTAVTFISGPSGQLVPQALFSVHWTLGQTFSLIIDRFNIPDRDDFERRYGAARRAFTHLAPEDTRGVGRNDPCPCGSTLKFKKCHGV